MPNQSNGNQNKRYPQIKTLIKYFSGTLHFQFYFITKKQVEQTKFEIIRIVIDNQNFNYETTDLKFLLVFYLKLPKINEQ